MPNTHRIADTMAEIMAREEDLLPACVISTTWPTVPVSSMTLAAFTTQAYVRDGAHLVYVDQPAITLTLTGSDGTYWLAIARDVATAYASWTRRAGSHYLWRLSGTRPADADGYLVFASCTVAGGVVTAVTPAPGVPRAEAWRALGGLGTMATQNASAVAVTGGTINSLTSLSGTTVYANILGTASLTADTATINAGTVNNLTSLSGGPVHLSGGNLVGLNQILLGAATSIFGARIELHYGPVAALGFRPDNDASPYACYFTNVVGTNVGSITTTAAATAFNTASDVRLKHAIAALTGALDAIAALRPVRFRWNADDSVGHGFLAHELQQTIPDAVSGLPDAVNADGSVRPQQVDHSRLVVWLVGAVQELAARVQSLEEQLGL